MSLRDELLRTPAAPRNGNLPASNLTLRFERSSDTAVVELRSAPGDPIPEDADAARILREQGLDPADWEIGAVRVSEWTLPNGDIGVSKRYSFTRATRLDDRPSIDELVDIVNNTTPTLPAPGKLGASSSGPSMGVIVALGDMQFGKIENNGQDGTEEVVERVVRIINDAAAQIAADHPDRDVDIAVCWLGDHVEGFVSQGGANTWRTTLTLNEQIRLLRRIMLHAVETFAPLTDSLTMVAVPGNHGEPQRFNGTGITRYDDSHDTEALIAVADACKLRPDLYRHVTFLVPDTDELTVAFNICGTVVLCAHGHKWRVGKHFDWWRGQAFHGNAGADATLLLAGHYHTFLVDSEGDRMFVQVPALETESTWWRMLRGVQGNPGMLMLTVSEGQLLRVEALR